MFVSAPVPSPGSYFKHVSFECVPLTVVLCLVYTIVFFSSVIGVIFYL